MSQSDDATRSTERVPTPRAHGPRDDGDSLALYKMLIDSVQDYAIFALDIEGRIMSWNPGAMRIKGYSADEIIGRHFSVFYPVEEATAGKPAWELDVALSAGRFEEEGWRVKKDGSQFWANVVITPLRDQQGTLLGFAKVTRDLTERRRTENALRESEERFRLIVQNVRDYGIFMLDPRGHVVSWNAGAERIQGYTATEIIGRHFSTFYPPEDNAAGKPRWELEVAVREGRFEDEGWRIRKDGTRYWANVVITALRNEIGELVGFGKVSRDLTERLAAEEQRVADALRVAEAEGANRAKTDFLAAMSHELRTPLNAISGFTELLVDGVLGPVNEAQRGYLTRIRDSQKHLLSLISDILNFSRVESRAVAYASEPIAVHEILDTAVNLLVELAQSREITLTQTECDTSVSALGDRVKVEQILLNLLSNALKFTPAEGFVEVSCEAEEGVVHIRVQDTGPGIARDEQTAVFEPFVQLGRSYTSDHGGAGLGLSISRAMARAMNGDLTVESAIGAGSTFTLTLPRA